MCYHCYVSICKPLHYGTLLGSRACAHMAAAAWASAFLFSLMHTANTFSLPLCQDNALGQFFCEVPHILKLFCSNSYLRELGLIAVRAFLGLGCFLFIVFSYVQIIKAVLRFPSEQGGRHKAFSTCLPPLVAVSLFVTTGTFTYLKPPSILSPSLDLALSLRYSVVLPALNPLIYSLRNQEVRAEVAPKLLGTEWNIMEARRPSRSQETVMEPGDPDGSQGTLMEPRLQRDTEGLRGSQESAVRLWNNAAPRFHWDLTEVPGDKEALGASRVSVQEDLGFKKEDLG
ncbi:olfactory receptor 14C36-like [Serinus canaria]|uniref:olfactory receptor 14C36-like n=1 Tax=Serinus canaria TaxID=9135 RepID=UPI0021CC7412|nr:olfactory receptor 14C36-like [Serinus canaria]